ncbi:DnaB-like helicase N-terminal domain-containing protein [Streptomyces lydicus]|uniref:DnaB-like helicase N-terminal domain-containing protein n=1 Tax=Streptomyces lydicus TaxID=47763 RepID=UPI0037A761A2
MSTAGARAIYGRMVLEGAIHRCVAQHATRLHQAARADAIRGGAEETVHHAQVLSDVLADLARRWGGELRPVAPAESVPPPPAHPRVVDEQLLADEEFLLWCLSAGPQRLDEVVLHPGDFTDAGHQQIYRSLGALHHRGEFIDQLTVLWETQRCGALADQTLDAGRVLRICNPSAFVGSAEYVGEQVVRASLVRTAAASARQVRALADDESLAPGQLIGYAIHALGPLEDVRRRWRIATGTQAEPRRAADPPVARIEAARSRSRPHLSNATLPRHPPRPRVPPSSTVLTAGIRHDQSHGPRRPGARRAVRRCHEFDELRTHISVDHEGRRSPAPRRGRPMTRAA